MTDHDELTRRNIAEAMRPNGPTDPEDRHPTLATLDELGTRMVRCPVTGKPGRGYFYLSARRHVDGRSRKVCDQCMTDQEREDSVAGIVDYRKRHRDRVR